VGLDNKSAFSFTRTFTIERSIKQIKENVVKRFFSQLLVVMVFLFAWAGMANAEETQGQQLTYIVKKGDTLWGIAKNFNTTWPVLQKINRIKNPDLIYPNAVMLIRNTDGAANIPVSSVHARVEKQGAQVVSKNTNMDIHKKPVRASVCDPANAITQLHFPTLVAQALEDKVNKGQFEEIVDQENFPHERARKYVTYDSENAYAFIYPESCSWRKKTVQPRPQGIDVSQKIPLPSDRNENEKLLALPLGSTSGNVEKGNEELSKQRRSELIVLVRYLNNCSAANNCDAREAKGELYMRRE